MFTRADSYRASPQAISSCSIGVPGASIRPSTNTAPSNHFGAQWADLRSYTRPSNPLIYAGFLDAALKPVQEHNLLYCIPLDFVRAASSLVAGAAAFKDGDSRLRAYFLLRVPNLLSQLGRWQYSAACLLMLLCVSTLLGENG